MRGLAVFLLVIAACASPVRAPRPAEAKPELVAIDMFGTTQVSREQLLAKFGDELRQFGEALMTGDHSVNTEVLLAKLYALGDFEDVSPALVGVRNKRGSMSYYLTIDFVDRADAARRMAFAARPKGTYPDPEGLLADWHTYEQDVLKRLDHRVECPAFHCLGDPTRSPRLRELSNKLAARAPAHLDELATILRDDQDIEHRAAAAFLLAYSKDGAWLMKQLVPAFRDSEPLVRNNAMRVTAEIAVYHPEVDVPIEPVLEALDYPATSDRNKAAAILDGLLARSATEELRHLVATRAGATLVAMLHLEQPNNHDYAYRILKKISGQTFGERDYASWDAWLRAQR